MQYEIIRTNDNNTATVKMTLGDNILVQDFDLGGSQDELSVSIEQGMAVFQSELDRNLKPAYTPTLAVPVTVSKLPVIPSEDLQPIDAEAVVASAKLSRVSDTVEVK